MTQEIALSCPPKLKAPSSSLEVDVDPSFLQALMETFEMTCKEGSTMSIEEYSKTGYHAVIVGVLSECFRRDIVQEKRVLSPKIKKRVVFAKRKQSSDDKSDLSESTADY